MRDDELDRILSQCEKTEIAPSSGFLASVMEAVRSEAATPPPIPFPWKRALPAVAAGVLALGLMLMTGLAIFTRGTSTESLPGMLPSWFGSFLEAAKSIRAGWIVLALVLSLASVKLSIRLAAWRA